MIVSSEIILLGDGPDGMVIAHESSRNLSNKRCACDFCGEVGDLSASAETHLQLLPLKLNIVGKELCEV